MGRNNLRGVWKHPFQGMPSSTRLMGGSSIFHLPDAADFMDLFLKKENDSYYVSDTRLDAMEIAEMSKTQPWGSLKSTGGGGVTCDQSGGSHRETFGGGKPLPRSC